MTETQTAPRRVTTVLGGIALAVSGVAMAGCYGSSALRLEAPALPITALAIVRASPPAAVMAVGGTLQLAAIGTTFAGDTVSHFDSVWYQYQAIADTARIRIAPSGLVTALASTGSSMVMLNTVGFLGPDIKGDQVVIQITPTAVAGPFTFSIQPVTPDSAKLAAGTIKTIVPVLKNSITGAAVAGPAVKYTIRGSDSSRVDVFRGVVLLNQAYPLLVHSQIWIKEPPNSDGLNANQITPMKGEGAAWIYATVNAYGTVLQDSVRYTFSYPYAQTISTVKVNLDIGNSYAGQVLTLAPAATITFQNGVSATDPLTVAYSFDSPAAAVATTPPTTIGGTSGNITALAGTQVAKRQFFTPGTYHWTAVTAGGSSFWAGKTLTGTIVIK